MLCACASAWCVRLCRVGCERVRVSPCRGVPVLLCVRVPGLVWVPRWSASGRFNLLLTYYEYEGAQGPYYEYKGYARY